MYFKPIGYFWRQTQLSLRPPWRRDTHCSFVACFKKKKKKTSVMVHIHSSFLRLYFRELSSLTFQHSGPDSSAFFYTEVALHSSSEKLQNPSLWFGCVYSSRPLVWAKPSLAAAHCLSLFSFFLLFFYSTRPLLLFARRLAASPIGQRMRYAKKGGNDFKTHYCVMDRHLESVLNCK